MDDELRRRLLADLDIDEEALDALEDRLSSFMEVCRRELGLTEEKAACYLQQPDGPLVFDVFPRGEAPQGASFSVGRNFLYSLVTGAVAAGVASAGGYGDARGLVEASERGDKRAGALIAAASRYFLRPVFLYTLARLGEKLEEAVRELSEEAVVAVSMHLKTLLPGVCEEGEPPDWAGRVRRAGDGATRRRLEPFAAPDDAPPVSTDWIC